MTGITNGRIIGRLLEGLPRPLSGFSRLSKARLREPKGLRGRGLTLILLLPLFVVGALASSFAGAALTGTEGLGLVGNRVALEQ